MRLLILSLWRQLLLLLLGFSGTLGSVAQTTAPTWTWTQGLHGPGNEVIQAVASDAAGNLYAVGSFEQTALVGGVSLTSRGEADAVIIKYDPAGTPVWIRHFGGAAFDRADQVCLDGAGNVFVAGLVDGPATFGGVTLTPRPNGTGFFVVKLDAQGTVRWGQLADSGNFTASYGLQPDGAGGAYVAGVFTNGVRLGSVSLPDSIGGAILARLDGQGTVQWVRQQAHRTLKVFTEFTGDGLAVAGGYVYACGSFGGRVTFSGTTLQAPNNVDAWLASYDAQGTLRWVRQGGSPTEYDVAHAVAADATGQVYVSGEFAGTATFGSLTLSAPGPASDAFLLKVDAQGTALWARQLGGSGPEVGYGVTLDGAGNVYQAGSYSTGTRVAGTLLPNQGSLDAYLLSYTGQGAVRWGQAAGGTGEDIALAITAPDALGAIYVAGGFASPNCRFGATTLVNGGPAVADVNDGFVARLSGMVAATRPGHAMSPLSFYPNPATNQVHLRHLRAGSTIQLVDATGRLLREATATATMTLSVQDLPPGLYLLRATNAQGQPCRGQVMVQ
ncbi:T9SS type A sorting domain-containing protein [Hymenobacter sp. YC55]|uniref:T9SS type A sorting domain-containing protein n=1 Tax=Hymenobacter sp. YC55 TaxID=3034019 RepID=UPI0023F8DBF3|nr:T9SS type A sorting domain-containing protein [Hymenobacter sp. YC55]MDF7815917.1 T9SS type A sorting domain-containing protein [Hymenobacter sp. YC55]